MDPHVVIHVGRYTSVAFFEGCLIYHLYFVFDQTSFAQVQVTMCNRCSHLSSNSLACFCSHMGHSWRPWRSRASKTHTFWGLWVDTLEVLVGWTTSGTWLAGATCPTTAFAGISTVQVLKLHRQIGTLEDPRRNSPQVTIGTTAAGNWGPGISSVSTWTTYSVL